MTKTKLPGLQKNVPLAQYTTFQIGGPAQYFYVAKNEAEMIKVIAWAQSEKLDFFILGGGSNLLVSEQGFTGLVIKDENVDFKIEGNLVTAGSGVSLAYFVDQCAENSLSGMEFLAGIPGKIGGAVRGNAGAWGQGIGELVKTVKILANQKIKELTGFACRFQYRDSLIKQENYPVISAVFQLQKGIQEEIKEKINHYLQERARKIPIEQLSAGSTFKNIDLHDLDQEKVKQGLGLNNQEFKEATKFGKLAAGYLIDGLGLAGQKMGGAQVSTKHANFIINTGGATADDVIKLISYIKQQVRDTTGIQLEEEVQYLGF